MTKKQHGGPRTPGPGKRLGRPPLPAHLVRKRYWVRLPAWLLDWLKAQPEPWKVIERAVIEFYGLEGPEESEAK